MCFFSNITTYKTKTGLLLIETFRKKNYGHQGSILGGLLLFIRGRNDFPFGEFVAWKTYVGG